MKQLLSAPNQLTLLRMAFLPFIVIKLVEGHYGWALALFIFAGLSDGLDGLLARTLKQQTVLGQYLDPIADKLLLSTMFLVLSILHKIPWKYTVLVFSRDISILSAKIPWKYTVLVFSRDISILSASVVLYAIAGLRDFRPSIFGKVNTFAQVAAVFFVMLFELHRSRWIWITRTTFLHATLAFTIVSGLHYVFVVGQRLLAHSETPAKSAARQQA